MERELVLRANTGSWNYNLQDENSDRDYKQFTMPTFSDLYNGEMYHKSLITSAEDTDTHDIRKLPDLLSKSNIAYSELLFSNDIWLCSDYKSELNNLISLAEDIAKIDLPKLFNTTGGIFTQRMKKLDRASEGTQHLVDQHGWNTKEGLHAFRTLNLLVRYEASGFTDFRSALRYNDEERMLFMAIKNGYMTKEEFIEFVNKYHDTQFSPMKEKFHEYKPDVELKKLLSDMVKDIVEYGLYNELYVKVQ